MTTLNSPLRASLWALLLLAGLGLAACDEGPGDEAADAVEETGDAISDSAEEAGDTLQNAAEEAGDAAEETTDQ